MVLDGVDHYRVVEPFFEAVRVVLGFRGDAFTPAYIQGISGAAFRIGGICPCAPTCATAMGPEELVRLLGYELSTFPISGDGLDPDLRARQLVEMVCTELERGRPVMVWHAFTNAEWDVVSGYIADTDEFVGRGSYAGLDEYAKASALRAKEAVDICGAFGGLFIGERVGEFDAPSAEVSALREAVQHARRPKAVPEVEGKWVMQHGLACYDRWVEEFQQPGKTRGVGDAYCYGIYRETHRAAAGFLREIAPRHGAASDLLLQAADAFEAEADTLDKGEKLLWWSAPEGPDPERDEAAAALLSQARHSYATGIERIEAALQCLA